MCDTCSLLGLPPFAIDNGAPGASEDSVLSGKLDALAALVSAQDPEIAAPQEEVTARSSVDVNALSSTDDQNSADVSALTERVSTNEAAIAANSAAPADSTAWCSAATRTSSPTPSP